MLTYRKDHTEYNSTDENAQKIYLPWAAMFCCFRRMVFLKKFSIGRLK